MQATPHNLPVQLTSFIGREREIENIARSLGAARLLPLPGPGGRGKTRLSIQVAHSLLDRYPDGVWFVDLAALTDPALVAPTLASTLGVREQLDRFLISTLIDHLAERSALIVLDNCEHLVRACASLADTLLRACPHLHILATSRIVLNIAGEALWRVSTLSLPGPNDTPSPESLMQYEAVRLFVERARLKQPDFSPSEENAPALVTLCHALDGMPLAIELAAARISMLPVERMVAHLGERFRLLVGGSRTAPARHKTLRATIDWSYDLLSESGQRLFTALSVFAGGFTLEAVEGVCGGEIEKYDLLDLLAALVDESLVLVDMQRGEARYRLLDTLRQYAREKLWESGREGDMRDRHLRWFLALAEEAQPNLHGPEQAAWLDRIDREHDNFRAALMWGRADCLSRPPVGPEFYKPHLIAPCPKGKCRRARDLVGDALGASGGLCLLLFYLLLLLSLLLPLSLLPRPEHPLHHTPCPLFPSFTVGHRQIMLLAHPQPVTGYAKMLQVNKPVASCKIFQESLELAWTRIAVSALS